MTIVKREWRPGDAYVAIANAAVQDTRLSFRARGVLASVMSRPPEWSTSALRLAAQSAGEGEHAMRRALRELHRYGYLSREVVRDDRGRLRTLWQMTDDPSSTGRRLPPGGQPPHGSPPVGQPNSGEPPDLVKEERKRRKNPPPPTPRAPGGAAALVVVVGEAIEGRAPAPGRRVLTVECARLADLGWTPEQLRRELTDHDWTGARAGAVIAWLRDQEHPPRRRHRTAVERPEWCGACDRATRLLLDAQERPRRGHPCPTCHPTRTTPTNPREDTPT